MKDKKLLIVFLAALILLCAIQVFASTQITSMNYDPDGNLISDGSNYYEYNSLNQLTTIRVNNITGIIVSKYFYDSDGKRNKKIVFNTDGTNTTTYYIGADFVRVVNSTGTYDFTYYYEDRTLVGRKDPDGSTYFYHPNNLGSTDIVTNQNGSIVEQTKYLPYGAVLSGGDSRFLFTGKEKDKETGLMYYSIRYYSPSQGKFIQPDLTIPNVYDPQSLNRYAYARDNPAKYVDDTGRFWHVALGAAMGGVIGSGASMISQISNGASIFDGTMNWGNVGKSGIIGSVSGAVIASTFGLGLATGTGYGSYALGGAISGFTGGRSAQLTSNLLSTDTSWNYNLLNGKDIAIQTGGGAALGIGGKYLESNYFTSNQGNSQSTIQNSQSVIENSQPTVYYRYGSLEEIKLIMNNGGTLRDGIPGRTYITPQAFTSAAEAQSQLSLENTPWGRVEFTIRNQPKITGPTIVPPDYGQNGGGIQLYSHDPIEVDVKGIWKFGG